MASNDI